MKTVAFVGNPNVGKTAWINLLSDAGFQVGNWPGMTVEKKEAKVQRQGELYHLIDLPGITGFQTMSNEEKITQDYLLQQRPDCLVQVLDATNLQRSLALSLALRAFQIPMLLIFNFYDEVIRNGIDIDSVALQRRLQCPVLCASVFDKRKKKEAWDLISAQCRHRQAEYHPLYSQGLEKEFTRQVNSFQQPQLTLADRMILAQQQLDTEMRNEVEAERRRILTQLLHYVRQDPQRRIARTRQIDQVLLHPVLGLPLLLLIFTVMMLLVFNGSAPFVDWMGSATTFVQRLVSAVLAFLPPQIASLINDGVLAGICGVLSFLPLMIMLTIMISLLEESGYMARIAFLMDRVMRPFGLSGRAFVALFMGIGCNVPAVLATRMIEDEKAKKRAALLVPMISCGARLPIYMVFTAAFFPHQGGLVIVCIYALGILTALLCAAAMSGLAIRKQPTWMVMELPVYRRPSFRVIGTKIKQEIRNYTRKAMSLVLWVMLLLWAVSYFPHGNITTSYAAQGARQAAFLFEPLGFGDRWELVASLPGSVAAKETVIGFLSTALNTPAEDTVPFAFTVEIVELAKELGEAFPQSVKGIFQLQSQPPDNGLVSAISGLFTDPLAKLRAFSFMVYCLLSVPCVLTLAALRNEYGWRTMLKSLLLMTILPYAVSLFIFQTGQLLFFANLW